MRRTSDMLYCLVMTSDVLYLLVMTSDVLYLLVMTTDVLYLLVMTTDVLYLIVMTTDVLYLLVMTSYREYSKMIKCSPLLVLHSCSSVFQHITPHAWDYLTISHSASLPTHNSQYEDRFTCMLTVSYVDYQLTPYPQYIGWLRHLVTVSVYSVNHSSPLIARHPCCDSSDRYSLFCNF